MNTNDENKLITGSENQITDTDKPVDNMTEEEVIERGKKQFREMAKGYTLTEESIAAFTDKKDLMLALGEDKTGEFLQIFREQLEQAQKYFEITDKLAAIVKEIITEAMNKEENQDKERRNEETIAYLQELTKKGIAVKNPDKADTEKLKDLIDKILTTADKSVPEAWKIPEIKESISFFTELQKHLNQVFSQEELDKFFNGEREFMVTARPPKIENLLKQNTKRRSGVTLRDFGADGKIRLQGRISIDEQKMSEMFRIAFKNQNFHGASKGVNRMVTLSFNETMEILGRTVTPENRKKFAKQLRDTMLPDIAHQYLEFRASDGSFWQIDIGGSERKVILREDRIYFEFSEKYAQYLSKAPLSQYNSKTLRLGSQRQPLPYYLAVKLQDHYFHDGNRIRNTHNILSIKAILQFCEEVLPSYEDVQRTDPGHWVDRIRKPLESALDDIKNIGLFEWEYCKKAMGDITEQERNTRDYMKWLELYITFKLIPEEPDQTERLAHKQERIEAAQEKKELREAQIIVEADKIQKRKARRKKKKDEDAPEESTD